MLSDVPPTDGAEPVQPSATTDTIQQPAASLPTTEQEVR
jgi:hypothetical protein